jgi:hypothetical protein
MITDEACWERGCACHDSRDSPGVELVLKREWVGLTDEEIEKACVPLGAAMLSFTEVARAIEAKLRSKNNE